MLLQRWEAKIRQKEKSPQPGIELTTYRSWVRHAHHWAIRTGPLLPVFFSFTTMFSNGHFLKIVLKPGIVWLRVKPKPNNKFLVLLKLKAFADIKANTAEPKQQNLDSSKQLLPILNLTISPFPFRVFKMLVFDHLMRESRQKRKRNSTNIKELGWISTNIKELGWISTNVKELGWISTNTKELGWTSTNTKELGWKKYKGIGLKLYKYQNRTEFYCYKYLGTWLETVEHWTTSTLYPVQ